MLRTYWHLEAARRVPSEYEIASSRLLHHPQVGFEVRTPVSAFYQSHESALVVSDWERFSDPRALTYGAYVQNRAASESHVRQLLREPGPVSSEWSDLGSRTLAVLRFPLHGLQMIAAYVGQMAPSGKLAIAAAFQAADQLRRVQTFSYRAAQLASDVQALGARSRRDWEDEPAWQPLRRVVERLLVTYDWAEALVAMNLVLEPALGAALTRLVRAAENGKDTSFALALAAMARDGAWHVEWASEALRVALDDRPENAEIVREWRARWEPLALEAVAGFAVAVAEE
jgi:toluene monooxygenase system protein E